MKFLAQRIHRSAAAWSFFATLLRVGANVLVLPFVLRQLPPGIKVAKRPSSTK